MRKPAKRWSKWMSVLVVCTGIYFVGWSGTPTQEFVEPLHNAFLEAQKNKGRTIDLREFTDFEWDRLDVVNGYASVLTLWARGIPWLRYSFEKTHNQADFLWIFRKNGIVTRFASTISVWDFDPESPDNFLPLLPYEYRFLKEDEAVFELVHLANVQPFADGPPIQWDMMIPVNATTTENSWRGVFEKCIHERFVYDECIDLAYQQHPYTRWSSWPR